jgi:hypothetical protein
MNSWDIILDIEAAETDAIIRSRLKELGWIKKPVVDYVETNSPDPRDAYTVRINGHVVGIHSQEENAKNHAWSVEAYIEDSE